MLTGGNVEVYARNNRPRILMSYGRALRVAGERLCVVLLKFAGVPLLCEQCFFKPRNSALLTEQWYTFRVLHWQQAASGTHHDTVDGALFL